jgi:hypothetical protein
MDFIKNKNKRQSMLGNYSQTLLPICFKSEFSEDQLTIRKSLIKLMSQQSEIYTDLKPRDLCDVVRSLTNLQLHNPTEKWIEKELRVLAKRSAFVMGDMDFKMRASVRDSFSMVDFYDADLVQMLKKYKLVKGSDKR